ncbi:xylulokinase [Hyphomonas sp.]|uniref:xylulokinase n=1 Tax=Hyphomonas sp. TaxID=87 RepID=UPI00391D3D7A
MFLGIDIGTSGVKTAVINDTGDVIDQAAAPLTVSRPHPLWSEQDPADWWAATQKAVLDLSPDRRAKIRGIGLSGQMHGATLLGASGDVLRPAILWNDGRSFAECAALEAAEPRLRQIAGNIAMPGFTAPKLLWVKQHEPEVFAKVTRVLLPKDYVRLLMTGEAASDMSDSAGTLWLDVGKRAWSPELLAATGLTESQMPRLFEGCEITGMLKPDVARAWGMEPVPVVAGGGDNAAGAVGVGVIRPGEAFLSLGTSGVLFLAGEKFLPNPDQAVHAFCHALPDRWHQMTVMLSAASCVDWAARLTGVHDAGELIALAETRGRLAGPEVFLPYLSGERTPHNNPHARGILFGLDHDSDAAAIGQAVLEGVAFAFADGLDALAAGGGEVREITVIGGGARSAWWGRVLAGALGRPLVYRRDGAVGPAYGAAKLALIGVTGTPAEDACAPPPVLFTIDPQAEDAERLAARRIAFREAYTRISPLYTMEPQ